MYVCVCVDAQCGRRQPSIDCAKPQPTILRLLGHPPSICPCVRVCVGLVSAGAFIIGCIGGMVYVGASYAVRKSGVDDPLDAFAIHGATGAWGVFALGLFHVTDGAFYGGGGNLLGWQCAGIVAIAAWSAGVSALVFGLLRACNALRVSSEDETSGLDKAHHGGDAYVRLQTRRWWWWCGFATVGDAGRRLYV